MVSHDRVGDLRRRPAESRVPAAEAAEPRDDVRGTAEFKRSVVRVYVERGLRQAVADAQAGQEG